MISWLLLVRCCHCIRKTSWSRLIIFARTTDFVPSSCSPMTTISSHSLVISRSCQNWYHPCPFNRSSAKKRQSLHKKWASASLRRHFHVHNVVDAPLQSLVSSPNCSKCLGFYESQTSISASKDCSNPSTSPHCTEVSLLKPNWTTSHPPAVIVHLLHHIS